LTEIGSPSGNSTVWSLRQVPRILLGYSVLHRDSTLHGIHSAGEIGKNAVTSRVEDPTSMRAYQTMDDDPVSREGAECANFIEAIRRL
jgi:hypothetical protein